VQQHARLWIARAKDIAEIARGTPAVIILTSQAEPRTGRIEIRLKRSTRQCDRWCRPGFSVQMKTDGFFGIAGVSSRRSPGAARCAAPRPRVWQPLLGCRSSGVGENGRDFCADAP
jgi:hypothetical protein